MNLFCKLPAPRWKDASAAGIRGATYDAALGITNIAWHEALADPGEDIVYNIYWSEDLFSLLEYPKAFSIGRLSANIPNALVADGYYFAVRPATKAIAQPLSGLGNMAINDTAYLYPGATQSISTLDGYIVPSTSIEVSTISGYPLLNGYLHIEDAIVQYDSIGTVDGYDSFINLDLNPFGCNEDYVYPESTEIILFKGFENTAGPAIQPSGGCAFINAEWADPYKPGIQSALDLGIGTAVRLGWKPAKTPDKYSTTVYNIYYSTELTTLFSTPKLFTTALEADVGQLKSGDGYFFGIKAAYFPSSLTLSSYTEVTPNVWKYPEVLTLDEDLPDGYLGEYTVVGDTSEHPSSGFIQIGQEVLEYSDKTVSSLTISRRDVLGFGLSDNHDAGGQISHYYGIEDLNTSYYMVTPSWDPGVETPWSFPDPTDPDGYASMQNEDGYRAWMVDNLNEDHTDFETDNIDFTAQDDLCGTYRTNTTGLINLYTGNMCNTYLGGREDGFGGGIRITEANLRRQELLLAQTGEPFLLLRHKVTGRQCPRFSIRGEHSTERCSICYGTRIVGGYDRYLYQRTYRPNITNPNGLIPMRVQPYKNDLPLLLNRGLAQTDELTLWAMSIPTIKKRDILIRFLPFEPGEIPVEEFRYEVLSVERNRLLFADNGKQSITVRRLDKTHEVMTYPAELTTPQAV